MPTYDYVCDACGHEFEHFQSMTDRHLRTCPACKKKKLRRKVGAGAGLIFKGSGFYITDYKKGVSSAASETPQGGGEKGAGEGGGGTKGEAPAAKPTESSESKPAAPVPAKPSEKPSDTASKGATKRSAR